MKIVLLIGAAVVYITLYFFVFGLIFLTITTDSTKTETYQQNAQPCIDAGGVPIQSVWDNSRLVDCVFPPQLGTEKE